MKKILCLDELGPDYIKSAVKPEEAEVTYFAVYTGTEVSAIPQSLLVQIVQMTSYTAFDLIILGEDNGQGLQLANVIVGNKRPQTIIVYHHGLEQKLEMQYRERGYTRFMTRVQLTLKLGEFLGLE